MTKRFEIDMTSGPLLKKIILYALPIVGINVLQLLFNAADVTVLGIFASDDAVAAVGATAPLVNLFVGFFVGLSLGANVMVARCMGANDTEKGKRHIGTSIFMSLIFGAILMIIGILFSKYFLMWMGCPSDLLEMATKYMRIYFLGMPIVMLYNFCAAILRAVGDTLRPFVFLVVGGVLNILLNVFFIIALKKDVEGVAIATVASQGVSGVLSLIAIIKGTGFAKLERKHFRIYKKELNELLQIGVPTGIQRSLFSISNLVVSSTIFTYGKIVVAGNTIGHQFDSIVHDATDAFAMSTLSFVSQNLGAKNFKRIWKAIFESLCLVVGVALFLGAIVAIFGRELCSIMTNTPEVIEAGYKRLIIMGLFYFLTGTMNVFANTLRGIGKSLSTMFGSLMCTVVFRILWIYLVYPLSPSMDMIYWVYPISWGLCTIVFALLAIPALKKLQREHENQNLKQVDRK